MVYCPNLDLGAGQRGVAESVRTQAPPVSDVGFPMQYCLFLQGRTMSVRSYAHQCRLENVFENGPFCDLVARIFLRVTSNYRLHFANVRGRTDKRPRLTIRKHARVNHVEKVLDSARNRIANFDTCFMVWRITRAVDNLWIACEKRCVHL